MKIKFNSDDLNIDGAYLEFEVEYYAGTPAPYCSDPNSPLFSDPGTNDRIDDFEIYMLVGTKKHKLSEIASELADDIFYSNEERILDLCQKKYLEESEYARFD